MRFSGNVICMSACWVAVLLAGCAGQQGMSGPSGNRSDIVTESDEPDHRRRARLQLELATGYFEQGQPNVALDEIKQSLAIDPTFVDAYNVRGLVYMRLNDIPLAEDSFRRALALNPAMAMWRTTTGGCFASRPAMKILSDPLPRPLPIRPTAARPKH